MSIESLPNRRRWLGLIGLAFGVFATILGASHTVTIGMSLATFGLIWVALGVG